MIRSAILTMSLTFASAMHAVSAEEQSILDLRKAVPNDAFVAVYARDNPERDYQHKYLQEVWDTVKETQIIERALKIFTSRVSEEDLDEASSVYKELRAAVEPIDLSSMLEMKEFIYAQSMQFPHSHYFVLMRISPEAAAGCEAGIKNLFELLREKTEGNIHIKEMDVDEVKVTSLVLSDGVPLSPSIARINDIVLLASSDQIARQSLSRLLNQAGDSKFDDPRFKQALSQLPEPEDSLVIYDAKTQFEQMRGISDFIRQQSNGNAEAERWLALMEKMFDELSFLDYEVTVEYTEQNRNCSAALGKLLPNAENKVLARMTRSGEPFENWHRWVPSDATYYRLSNGVNLLPLYDWVVKLLTEDIPEAGEALRKFEKLQSEFDVNLRDDILQAFSGEFVSIAIPAPESTIFGGQHSVIAMRCQKPDRLAALLNRSVEAIAKHPALIGQQLKLVDSKDLEGFKEVSATFLTMFGVRPVIGYHEGWMIIGSGAETVRKVLHTRAGAEPTIAETEAFQRFHLNVEGPVQAISYTNVEESTRQVAKMLNQVGMFAPAIIALAGAQADAEELQPVQELLGLLPSVAKIISKFDFYQAKLSVTQEGKEQGTYLRHGVVLVRPDAEE